MTDYWLFRPDEVDRLVEADSAVHARYAEWMKAHGTAKCFAYGTDSKYEACSVCLNVFKDGLHGWRVMLEMASVPDYELLDD